LKEEEELKPFGGYVQPQKTIGISLKSTVGNEKTEKHGYNVCEFQKYYGCMKQLNIME